ncbi:thioredoxin [Vampirovibrio chlorellavorus]|jgi:thioredoxin 1|uniref:thioredoxin n=1 Tax=Vampirovibrio chlorellavorus TaxID=758823 RepID=UPI0026E98143|nr:thioredoxin [Vampirovibrio chlorellavorus]
MGNVLNVTDESFEQEVKKADVPVLVDFWAPWCGPCRALAPVIDELASEYEGKLKVVKVNTDDSLQTAQNYHISGIPTLIIFKNGEPVEQMVGNHKKSTLTEVLNKHLNN